MKWMMKQVFCSFCFERSFPHLEGCGEGGKAGRREIGERKKRKERTTQEDERKTLSYYQKSRTPDLPATTLPVKKRLVFNYKLPSTLLGIRDELLLPKHRTARGTREEGDSLLFATASSVHHVDSLRLSPFCFPHSQSPVSVPFFHQLSFESFNLSEA